MNLICKLLRVGKIKPRIREKLEDEGIIVAEQSLSGVLINTRTGGARRKTWFAGAFVLTKERITVLGFSRKLINIKFCDSLINNLTVSSIGSNKIKFHFHLGDFKENTADQVTIFLKSPKANLFIEKYHELSDTFPS